jgi:hypothetical protein
VSTASSNPFDAAFLERIRLVLEPPRPTLGGPGAGAVWEEMTTWDDGRLARTDPAVLNLEVAKGIPALKDLEIAHYCRLLDQAAAGFGRWLPLAEQEFHAHPEDWSNDLVPFRLGMLCQFIEQALGVRYTEAQKHVKKITYTNPGDLFLNGVLDTKRGTCGNMAVLYLCLCWRLGWPVSLALSGWHTLCRYDDDARKINIETTAIGEGGFSTPPDEHYIKADRLSAWDIQSGSDLTALRPRQVLGCFFGARGRYWYDRFDANRARDDYGRASELFPQSRLWREKWRHASGLASRGY